MTHSYNRNVYYSNANPSFRGPMFSYHELTPQQRLEQYEMHNPGSLNSNDPQVRLYGRCGCQACGETRKEWASRPTALDKPGRQGGGSMASVNLCDRKGCKSMVQGKALGNVYLSVSSEPGAERKEVEICPACVADVLALLESAPVTDREPAYRDPYTRPTPVPEDMSGATNEQLAAELFQRMMRQQAIEGTVSDGRDERTE